MAAPHTHQLSPQSSVFAPARCIVHDAEFNTALHTQHPQTPQGAREANPEMNPPAPLGIMYKKSLSHPWTDPVPDSEAAYSIRALNQYYDRLSIPEDERDNYCERYHAQVMLCQVAIDLRDGLRKPHTDAGFFPSPKMEDTDPSNTTVFIGGLNSHIPSDLLRVFFIPYGEIEYVSPVIHGSTNDADPQVKTPDKKNCGFVRYRRRRDAERAMVRMQGFELEGCRFRLSWGKNMGSHDNRLAPPNTVGPALIGRLANYIDAQQAKALLCCIEDVFKGNTSQFREALEFLASSVADCNHKLHAGEQGPYSVRGSRDRTRSYPLPFASASNNPNLSPRTRDHLLRTGEQSHDRQESTYRDSRDRSISWPSDGPSLNAGARAFQQGQRYGQTYPAHYGSSIHGMDGPHGYDSASSDEFDPLELGYGIVDRSEATKTQEKGNTPRQPTTPSDGSWSDADIAPSYWSGASHTRSSPDIWGAGLLGQSTVQPSWSAPAQNGAQYPAQPTAAYDQNLSVSAPNHPADITSAGIPHGSSSNHLARRSSDPVNDASGLAAQGHFGSVGQHAYRSAMDNGPNPWTASGSTSGSATLPPFNPFGASPFTPAQLTFGGAPAQTNMAQHANASGSTTGVSNAAGPQSGPASLARAIDRLSAQHSGSGRSVSSRASTTPRAMPPTPALRPIGAGSAPSGPRATVRA